MDEFRQSGRMLQMKKRKRIEARSRREQGYKPLAKGPPVTWWPLRFDRMSRSGLTASGQAEVSQGVVDRPVSPEG